MNIEGLEEVAGTDLIQDTFLFKLLNFDQTMALARLCRRERLERGDVIIEENALGQALYLIEKGRVKVYKGEGDSREELAVLGRGELFGEMSLIEDDLTSASVVADGEVDLLIIRREDFEGLMEGDRELALRVYKTFCHILSERLRKTSEEFSSLKAEVGHGKRSGPKVSGSGEEKGGTHERPGKTKKGGDRRGRSGKK
jgi:CRP/FNR family cyclic AMP-dependent transcriptional regulator